MAEPIPCPSCQRLLNVPETFHGQMVQCPDCTYQFLASAAAGGIQAEPPPLTPSRPLEDAGVTTEPRPVSQDRVDDDDFRRDVRPMPRRSDMMPHRGSMIFTLGIVSIFFAPFILGAIAWILGNADLKAMQEGRMDPAGEGQTRTGRMIGKVMVIFNIVVLLLSIVGACLFFGIVILSGDKAHH